jgi:hypothetical protein
LLQLPSPDECLVSHWNWWYFDTKTRDKNMNRSWFSTKPNQISFCIFSWKPNQKQTTLFFSISNLNQNQTSCVFSLFEILTKYDLVLGELNHSFGLILLSFKVKIKSSFHIFLFPTEMFDHHWQTSTVY